MPRELQSCWFTILTSTYEQEPIADAGQRIAYLQDQLDKTSLTEMQRVFYALIEEQTKRLMLADTRKDYAFAIIDPSVVPMEPSAPNRSLIVVFGLFFGLLAGLLLAYLRGVVRASRIASTELNDGHT